MDATLETTVLGIFVGLGLAAACGFRIFVPFLVMSLAARGGHLELSEGFDWIASDLGLGVFLVATVAEVGSYYIPWLDNLLDAAATPTAVIAGVVATASQVGGLDPMLGWTVSVLGGGGTAGLVQGLTVVTRQMSSLATGGFGNPIVSTLEGGFSIVAALAAIIVPVFAVFGLLVLFYLSLTRIYRFWEKRRNPPTPATA